MKNISDQYRSKGVVGFYSENGADYSNPHEPIITKLLKETIGNIDLKKDRALDLACGSGEAYRVLKDAGFRTVDAIDPYTYQAFKNHTGCNAGRFTFEEIASGALSEREYELIVCSFAMHLLDESWLPKLCYGLSNIAQYLIIITPHKRPFLLPEWGWVLAFEAEQLRVRSRVYCSEYHST